MTDECKFSRIRVEKKLDEGWSDWFDGMTVTFESDITTLTGAVVDQAALRGILTNILDLNLTLRPVNRIEIDSKTTRKKEQNK